MQQLWAAKADLVAMGVAVDKYAKVTIDNMRPSKLYEASLWAADKRAAVIVRPAPVQSADTVPPKSLGRDMAAAKAVQAAKLHSEMPPEQQAIMLCAGGPGTGTLDGHAPVTDRIGAECAMEDGHYDSVQRQMQARAPRVFCGEAMMGTCASNLWLSTLSTRFAASTDEPGPNRPHRAVPHTLRRLIEQEGTMS